MHDFSKDACLLTDFYQFTMAQAYFDQGRHQHDAVFHLFFRKNPFGGNWTIAAGIKDALDYIANLRFNKDAMEYLASITVNGHPMFSQDFLALLEKTRAHVDVFGVRDGDVVFPQEPILRVQGPLFLCQLLETPLLNIINFQTLIATKAQRIALSANNKPVMDFGLRRAQGFDGAISATKAAYIGGISSTSNVWAARHFAIPPSGTQAHSFIMSYESQTQAFTDFCQSHQHNPVLLVDTYEPIQGINDAITVFLAQKSQGHTPFGIRIDSGDLVHLSKLARNLLDRAGLHQCKIIASGDLDEHEIARLEDNGAPIDIYGVGTRLVTGFDDPALSGVYKLSSIHQNGHWRDAYKESALREKQSLPGHQAITRFFGDEYFQGDLIYDLRLGPSADWWKNYSFQKKQDLHLHLMHMGAPMVATTLNESRENAKRSISFIPKEMRRLTKSSKVYPVYIDDNITHKNNFVNASWPKHMREPT